MTKPKVVPLPDAMREKLLHYVRDLLRRCESGEVATLVVFEESPNGDYNLVRTGTKSKARTAGLLLDAAIRSLSRE